jgi:hypothetical protein
MKRPKWLLPPSTPTFVQGLQRRQEATLPKKSTFATPKGASRPRSPSRGWGSIFACSMTDDTTCGVSLLTTGPVLNPDPRAQPRAAGVRGTASFHLT